MAPKYKFNKKGLRELEVDSFPDKLVISNSVCLDKMPEECPFCNSKNLIVILSPPYMSGYIIQQGADFVCTSCGAKFIAFTRDYIEPDKVQS